MKKIVSILLALMLCAALALPAMAEGHDPFFNDDPDQSFFTEDVNNLIEKVYEEDYEEYQEAYDADSSTKYQPLEYGPWLSVNVLPALDAAPSLNQARKAAGNPEFKISNILETVAVLEASEANRDYEKDRKIPNMAGEEETYNATILIKKLPKNQKPAGYMKNWLKTSEGKKIVNDGSLTSMGLTYDPYTNLFTMVFGESRSDEQTETVQQFRRYLNNTLDPYFEG